MAQSFRAFLLELEGEGLIKYWGVIKIPVRNSSDSGQQDEQKDKNIVAKCFIVS
jgi:hypothetical protein